MNLATFGLEVASEKPTPGGGSVCAYTGSLAASLLSMVSRLTLKRQEYQQYWPKVEEVLAEAESLRQRLMSLVDEDSLSFASLMRAYSLPKESELEKRARSTEIQSGLRAASETPLRTAEAAARVISLATSLAQYGNKNVLSDLQIAIYLAYASILGALSNVTINLHGMKDEAYRERMKSKVRAMKAQAERSKSLGIRISASRMKR
jgi:glutamate formiminotransferase/formiminotetrahydrofolate cyclodeaminase